MFGMGKKPPPPPAEKTRKTAAAPAAVSVTLKLTPAQRQELERLGGEAWLREQLDRSAAAAAFQPE